MNIFEITNFSTKHIFDDMPCIGKQHLLSSCLECDDIVIEHQTWNVEVLGTYPSFPAFLSKTILLPAIALVNIIRKWWHSPDITEKLLIVTKKKKKEG